MREDKVRHFDGVGMQKPLRKKSRDARAEQRPGQGWKGGSGSSSECRDVEARAVICERWQNRGKREEKITARLAVGLMARKRRVMIFAMLCVASSTALSRPAA